MTDADHPGAEAAEQAAAMLTAAGMPRMPARVMMALVGSPDEGYTAAELAERLGVSAAAVSGAVRYLQTMRIIHRLSRAGDRRDRYDLVDDGWHAVLLANAPLYESSATASTSSRTRTTMPRCRVRARGTCPTSSDLRERMPQLSRSGMDGHRRRGCEDLDRISDAAPVALLEELDRRRRRGRRSPPTSWSGRSCCFAIATVAPASTAAATSRRSSRPRRATVGLGEPVVARREPAAADLVRACHIGKPSKPGDSSICHPKSRSRTAAAPGR